MWLASSPFPNKPAKREPKLNTIRVRATGERAMVDTVWLAVGNGRQLSWKISATAKIGAKVMKDCRKTVKEIKSSLNISSKKSSVVPADLESSGAADTVTDESAAEVFGIVVDEFKDFGKELGLELPVLRQAVAAVKLGIAVGKVAKSGYNLKSFYDAYKQVQDVEITNLAGKALKGMLQKELAERSFSVATCTLDLIASTADPTSSASGALKASAKLAFRLVQLYRSYKLVKDVNLMLRERDLFDLTVIGRMPLIGCYLFPNIETSQLLGVFYDMEDDVDDQTRKTKVGEMLDGVNIKDVEKKYVKYLKPLEVLAKERIQLAPYELIVPGSTWAAPRK